MMADGFMIDVILLFLLWTAARHVEWTGLKDRPLTTSPRTVHFLPRDHFW
jgi:hypothetical protein